MKILKKIVYLFLIVSVPVFTSCDEGGDPDKVMTTTGSFAGDWFITARDSDGNPIPGVPDNALHSTYNTAANDNTMWMDDHTNSYEIKSKFTIDTASGLFSSVDSPNFYDVDEDNVPQSTTTITEGQIIRGGATSKGGHTVDKITFRVHYSYDPAGYDIVYEGHKRTGFAEDEY